MPTQQLVYEGADLQALIQRVVDEHGPARIRPPERRRKGGVFGFFTREVYVISVDPEATERAGHRQVVAAGSVLGSGSGSGTSRPGAAGTVPDAAGRPPSASGRSPAPGSLAELIDATEDDLDLGTSPAARPSEPGPAGPSSGHESGGHGPAARPRTVKPFSQVLSEVASSLGEEPGTYRPPPERLRRITPLVPPPARPSPERDKGALAAMIEHPAGAGETAAPVPDPAPSPAPATLNGSAAAAATTPAAAAVPSPSPAVRQLPTSAVGSTSIAPSRPLSAPVVDPAPSRPTVPADGVAADATPRATSAVPPSRPGLGTAVVDLLRSAGFPQSLLPVAGEGRSPVATLEEAFAGLPEAPALPTVPGGLVALVGDARAVRSLARVVASAVGCPSDEVAVASPSAWNATPAYRARTPEEAETLARGWRRDRVGVVAVHAPTLGTDQSWTRGVLRALRPSCVWGVASAVTKSEDVRRWVDAIGGADALALADVPATATPAAVLSVGLPVARLDDERATPQRWAAVVADLLTEGS